MSVHEKVKDAAEAAKEAVDHAADKGHELADHARTKTHDFKEHTQERAHHAADTVREKTHEAREKVSPKVRRVPTWVWAALALLAVALIAFFVGRSTSGKKGGGKSASAKKKPAPPPGPPTLTLNPQQLKYSQIAMAVAPRVSLPMQLKTIGTVAANLNGQAPVMARLSGKVTQVPVNVGQAVRAGQVLAVISSQDLFAAQAAFRDAEIMRAAARAELLRLRKLASLGEFSRPALEQARLLFSQSEGETQAAKDAVNIAQAQAAQARTQAALTQSQLARDQALYAALLLSKQDLDQAAANAAQAAQARDAALSALRQAVDRQVNLQKRAHITQFALSRQKEVTRSGALNGIQIGPAYSRYVKAAHEVEATAANVRLLGGVPMDESDPGAGLLQITAPIAGIVGARTVALGQNVMPSDPLMTVLNLNTVIVQLTVYQEDLSNVHVGQQVQVISNAAPNKVFFGKVSVISAALNETTRTATVNCLVQNQHGALRPGVYVSGIIYGASQQNAVAIPFEAVQKVGQGQAVFTPTGKPGEFAATPVKTGVTVGGLTQILSGLQPGQQYVSKNAFVLKSQMIKDTLD